MYQVYCSAAALHDVVDVDVDAAVAVAVDVCVVLLLRVVVFLL